MKTKTILTGLSILLILAFALPLDTLGQGKAKKNGPPPWAPAYGYKAKTRHVYFPDHNFYFDVQKNVYIYKTGSVWKISKYRPSQYAGVNLKKTIKVEIELDTDSPQKFNPDHIMKYKTKAKGGQVKVKKVSAKVKIENSDKGKAKKKKK